MEIVEIEEKVGRGTRGSQYVYVAEGNLLVHISEYANKKRPKKLDDKIKIIIYEVVRDKVKDKPIYVFSFSNSGHDSIYRCSIDDFENGNVNIDRASSVSIDEIRHLRFKVRDPELESLLNQFNQILIPMINEIEEYEEKLNFEISFGHQMQLRRAFIDPDVYYFSFMSLPNDKSRIRSFKVTRRWIYQLWVLKLLCEALRVSKFKREEYRGKPYWFIEQGSEISTAIGECPIGDVTFWLEYQPSKYSHMIGIFLGRYVPIRPDIVVAKGSFKLTKEFVDSKKPIELIIECKEGKFEEWEKDIELQIIPYKNTFNPRNFIVVSLEPCPKNIKEKLETRGIKVIDDLKPGSKSVNIFYDIIEKLLL